LWVNTSFALSAFTSNAYLQEGIQQQECSSDCLVLVSSSNDTHHYTQALQNVTLYPSLSLSLSLSLSQFPPIQDIHTRAHTLCVCVSLFLSVNFHPPKIFTHPLSLSVYNLEFLAGTQDLDTCEFAKGTQKGRRQKQEGRENPDLVGS
jgi:hypothetical protein